MNVLKTENLKKYYGSGDSLVKALDGVNYFHWHFPIWYLLGYAALVLAAPLIFLKRL